MAYPFIEPAALQPSSPAAVPTAPQPPGSQLRAPTGADDNPLPRTQVTRGGKCRPARASSTTLTNAEIFVYLRISKLRRDNAFPRQNGVLTLAFRSCTFLSLLQMSNCSLQEAQGLATSSQLLLRDEFAQDIVTLYGLVGQASRQRYGLTIPSVKPLNPRQPRRIHPEANTQSTASVLDDGTTLQVVEVPLNGPPSVGP